MRHLATAVGTLLVATAFTAPSHAGNVELGEELHQENCVTCHVSMVGGDGSELYTRHTRNVQSFDSLVTQVNTCNVNLGMGWFDDEVEAVGHYLNQNYYQF